MIIAPIARRRIRMIIPIFFLPEFFRGVCCPLEVSFSVSFIANSVPMVYKFKPSLEKRGRGDFMYVHDFHPIFIDLQKMIPNPVP
jgi:hypothetical protein